MFSALNGTVENKDISICLGLEDENVLVEGLLDVENVVDLEGHGLARPLRGDLAEPAVYMGTMSASVLRSGSDPKETIAVNLFLT